MYKFLFDKKDESVPEGNEGFIYKETHRGRFQTQPRQNYLIEIDSKKVKLMLNESESVKLNELNQGELQDVVQAVVKSIFRMKSWQNRV